MDWGRRGRGNGRLQGAGCRLKVRKRARTGLMDYWIVGLMPEGVGSRRLQVEGCRLKVRKRARTGLMDCWIVGLMPEGVGSRRLQGAGCKLKVRKRFPEPVAGATRVGLGELRVEIGRLKAEGGRFLRSAVPGQSATRWTVFRCREYRSRFGCRMRRRRLQAGGQGRRGRSLAPGLHLMPNVGLRAFVDPLSHSD